MNNRILIVEDDRTTRRLLAGLLQGAYDVTTAASGEEALLLAAQESPALVLLDLMMPGIDGYETCRRLKAMFPGRNLQVIMVSAAASREEQLRAFELGADAYLAKPIDPFVLCSEVRLHFRLRDAIARVSSVEAEIQTRRAALEKLVEQRNREIAATQDVAVLALAKLAESRDEGTGEHLLRVRSHSQLLAEQLRREGPYATRITQQFLTDLFRASPLHDIGKVSISDAILLKPGRLTPEEFEVVKMHTVLGANILQELVLRSSSGSFLAMAVSIAMLHHERFDGKGYPVGLRGEEIPLQARIVALADVFDVITSCRPYKTASSPQEARRIILEESGTQFDPVIVEAFNARFEELAGLRGQTVDDALPGGDTSLAMSEIG